MASVIIGYNPLPRSDIPDMSSSRFAPHDRRRACRTCMLGGCNMCVRGGCASCMRGGCAECMQIARGGQFDVLSHIPELHLPGYNFCGPGTNLTRRLNPDRTPKLWSTPINGLDNICYRHDLAYDASMTRRDRHAADDIMIRDVDALLMDRSLSKKERLEAKIANSAIRSKLKFGLGHI